MVFQTGNSLKRNITLLTVFFLLGAAFPVGAEQGKATTNFTFGKKEKQKPAPAPVVPAPAAVPAEPVEAPVPAPVAPAPPAVHAEPVEAPEPVEPPVRPELVEAPVETPAPTPTVVQDLAPVPPPETLLISDEHSHPSAPGVQSHAVELASVTIPAHSMIVQEVWLDPKDPPRGIAVQFQRVSGDEAGVYWEGEEEVFNPAEYEELWYYGMLPELGKWVSLDILTEDLGLENNQLAGIRFVTLDGRALWRKTLLTEAPPLEGSEETSATAPPTPSVSTPPSQ